MAGSVAAWITTLLGTVVGLFALLVAGAGKLLPFHPLNKAMAFGFSNVYGPFMGFPGLGLRIIVGLGEFAAGLGLLIGLWGDVLGCLGKELVDIAKALIIDAGVALFACWSVASLMHTYLGGSKMSLGLSVATLVMVLIRMLWCGPDKECNQVLCTVLAGLLLASAVVAMIINKHSGRHESTVEKDNRKLQEMMQ